MTNSTSTKTDAGIRSRMFYGFAAIIAVFVLSTVVGMILVRSTQLDIYKFLNVGMPANHALVDLQGELLDIELNLPYIAVLHDSKVRDRIDNQLAIVDKFKVKITQLIDMLDSPAATEKWMTATSMINSYQAKVATLFKMIDSGELDKALTFYRNDIMPFTTQVNDSINVDVAKSGTTSGVLDAMTNYGVASMEAISGQVRLIFVMSVIFLLLSVILSYIIANLTSKSIINPIQYAIGIAKKIANGKRNVEIKIERNDEMGQLLESLSVMRDAITSSEIEIKKSSEDNKRLYDSVVKSANLFSEHASRVSAGELKERLDLEKNGIDEEIMLKLGNDLNNMTRNLNNVTHDIVSACSNMVTTLDEVRHAVDAQSSGASEQASSINEITASITEIEKSASQTMSKAKDLGGVAEKTRKNGQLGLESIEASVMGMKSVRDRVSLIAQTILDLSRQTQQVGEITSVVNNLAQQSKMLALNASIEAAKAGDAGKGFAVVAAEVKNLAEQSEQSTSQVQKILEDIKIATEKAVMVTEEGTKGVDSGLQMIERTGEIIRNLNEVIREAAIASQQIESAVRQESAGIEQITAGMNEINIVTSSFVESVSQTTEAMDNLAEITNKLKSSVETYKI